MAGWRQAVALAMTGEEIEALTALSRSRTEPAGRVSRAAMLLGYREKPSFFAVGRRLGVHHQTVQRCVERAMAYGALAALDDRPRSAKSRRSRRRPRPGWYLWPATRPRSTAIRMNCGRHGFWPAMRASADRRRVTNVSPVWLKAPCASFSVKRKSSRTRCATIWNAATPSSSPRWRKFCVSTARSRCQGGEIEEAGRDRLLRREAWNPGHRHDGTGFAASARPPCELRAGS